MPAKRRAFVDFQAIIIAGPGHQLYPLVDTHSPKCLLPIANRPMIVHVLNWLTASGISNTLVLANPRLAGPLAAAISRHCEPHTHVGIIPFVEDKGASGTMAALLAARPFIKNDFILLPCDLVTDASLAAMADQHRGKEALVTCLMSVTATTAASKNGGSDKLFVGLNGQQIAFVKRDIDKHLSVPLSLLRRHPSIALRTDLFDSHCYMFSRDIYEHPALAKGDFYSVREDLIPALVRHGSVYAYLHSTGHCLRANTTVALMEANRLLCRPRDTLTGENVVLGDRSTFKRSIIGHHVTIGRNVRITNSLLMDHVVIQDNCKLDNVFAAAKSTIRDACELKDCQVGPQYVIERETAATGESFSVIELVGLM